MQSFPAHTEYKDFLKQNCLDIDVKNSHYYLKKNSFISNIVNVLPCGIYILNYQTGQYMFISQSTKDILGYAAQEFMQKGLPFFMSLIHPDDLKIISGSVFKDFLAYTKSIPAKELKECRFSHNYRVKRADGCYIHVLQQYVVLECNHQNYPVLTLGFVTDISAHKHDNVVTFSVTERNSTKGFSITTAQSHPAINLNISQREAQVIKRLTQGLSSKQIADKLHISLHTVNAHRRNILKKTGCQTTAQLISYAIANGL